MGPVILARALERPRALRREGARQRARVHGAPPPRALPRARRGRGCAGASAVLVGSRHTAESLWEVMDDPDLPGAHPPGAARGGRAPVPAPSAGGGRRGPRTAGGARWRAPRPPAGAGSRVPPRPCARSTPPATAIVGYVGKLIVSKGVDLLLAAWPLVVAEVPDARLCVVGFGTYREGLARIVAALGAADLDALGEVAARGRELEGGPARRADATWRPSSTAWTASGARPTWPRRRRPRTASTSPAGWSTRTCPTCCRHSRPRWCPARSPRRSAWWPPRRRPAGRCRCPPRTPGWRR